MTATALRVVADNPLPARVDESAVERSTNVLLKSIPALRPRWDADWENLVGIDCRPDASDGDREAGIRRIEAALAPIGAEPVVGALQQLRLITAGRGLEKTELTATLVLYAKRLGHYPADVVLAVCDADRHEWFPPLKTLVDAAERLVRPRRMMREALQRGAARRLIVAEAPSITHEDRTYVAEAVRKAVAALRSS